MTRFAITAALATILGLSLAGTADAQYTYQYGGFTPYGGYATTQQSYNFGRYQTYNTYVSPFGMVNRQVLYGDAFGNRSGRASGYNAFNGYGHNSGFFRPGFNPYGGYSYNFYGRRY